MEENDPQYGRGKLNAFLEIKEYLKTMKKRSDNAEDNSYSYEEGVFIMGLSSAYSRALSKINAKIRNQTTLNNTK